MKNVRLILVNNPTTALFMAAAYRQKRFAEADGMINISIYHGYEYDEKLYDHMADITGKSVQREEAVKEVMQLILERWYVLPTTFKWSDRAPYNKITVFRPKTLFLERRSKKEDIEKIKEFLSGINVKKEDVREIWHGNGRYVNVFKHIISDAKMFSFEHGLGDIRNAVLNGKNKVNRENIPGKTFEGLLGHIDKSVKKLFFQFSNDDIPVSQNVSILSDEIEKTKPAKEVVGIDPSGVIDLLDPIMSEDPCSDFARELKGNNVILMMQELPVARDRDLIFEYFAKLEKHIVDDWSDWLDKYEIRNIIIKERAIYNKLSEEAIRKMDKLRSKYNVDRYVGRLNMHRRRSSASSRMYVIEGRTKTA